MQTPEECDLEPILYVPIFMSNISKSGPGSQAGADAKNYVHVNDEI